MRIRRSRLTRDYTQVPNATVRDDRLSHMARGILVELLSRPDGWEATADDMWRASVAKHGKNSPGRRMFRAAFAELKGHGYLTASREVLPGGRHATTLVLTDVPQAGTSDSPAETREIAGRSDVPHAGMSADVPQAGTSVPPARTGVSAGRSDIPLSDVPHAGTSKRENSLKNTPSNHALPAHRPAQGGKDGQQQEDQALAAAAAFLENLPDPWTIGRVTAKAMAPQLLEAITEQGWELDEKLIAKLTENPHGINHYSPVLRRRIEDLPKAPRADPANKPGPALPPWCGHCGDGNPAARFNARWRTTPGTNEPCPKCHPDTQTAQAA